MFIDGFNYAFVTLCVISSLYAISPVIEFIAEFKGRRKGCATEERWEAYEGSIEFSLKKSVVWRGGVNDEI